MTSDFTVTFWGVRGSFPTPGPQTARVGGNTPSLHVRAGSHDLIFDAGTGIIGLGRMLAQRYREDKRPLNLTLFFTHTHHDHTQGFPFFIPARFPLTSLYIFGPKTLHQDLQDVLSRSMLPPVFPITIDELPCQRVVRNVSEAETVQFDPDDSTPRVHAVERDRVSPHPDRVSVAMMRSYAHPNGVFIYRVNYHDRVFVFATDTESYIGGDQRLIRFARGASLLVHDAQYTDEEYADPTQPKQGWGHSTWAMAVNMAQAAGAGRLALFHHEPEHSDALLESIECQAHAILPATILAREGMTLEI